MSQIIKAFTGVYMVLLLMLIGTGILGASLQVLRAQNLHGRIVDELENSDYARPVLLEAFAMARNQGMDLQVTLYLEDGASWPCEKAEDVPEHIGDVDVAEVLLRYEILLPLIQEQTGCYVAGYAR